MEIKLINGSFSNEDAIKLITDLIDMKIRFHENKINMTQNEEDIKTKEKRIIQLQNEMRKSLDALKKVNGNISMLSEIKIVTHE